MKKLPLKRRLVQLYAAMLYNAHLKGFASGKIYQGVGKNLCVPGLNCYSCPGAAGACPLGALQNAVASSATRAPFYIIGMLMLFGLTLGRVICGWLCPFGMIQDLLHKIPTPKIKKSRVTRALSLIKYVLLALFVFLIPIWYAYAKNLPLPAFCKYICPAGTLEGAGGLLLHPDNTGLFAMLGGLFTWKVVLTLVILTGCIFAYRAFCRFICPLGAIYALFAKLALLGVKLDEDKCIGCDLCVKKCPMDIRCVGDRECIHCGACVSVCPTKAISWKGPKLTKARRKIAWIAAGAVLAAALVCANLPDGERPVGAETGMTCPGFTVPLYEGGEFTLNPGRTTVINFWATWCTPCVAELPYFEQLAAEHPEIDVIAVHSSLVTEDVEKWIQNSSLDLTFALDEAGDVIASLGGGEMLPQTVIVDSQGVIVYNQIGSVTYEDLARILPED